jgi:hypothetical protein
MYTYGGDANLDGKINVDDYGRIDSSIGLAIAGWYNGDFNYDGKVNIDDYGIIDNNSGIQGAPFGSGASDAAAAVRARAATAIPEPPAMISVLMLVGTVGKLVRRRRP